MNNPDLQDRLNKVKGRRRNHRTPLPWSGQYEASVGAANRNRDLSLSQSAADEQTLRKGYGFDDSSDPFSRSRTLQEGFQNATRGTTNNYAAAGQLYAGSMTNAHNIDRNNFEREWDAARKEYAARLDEVTRRRLDTQVGYQDEIGQAEAQRLADAVAQRVDPAEAPKNRKRGRRRR